MSGGSSSDHNGAYQWGHTNNVEVLVSTTDAQARSGPGMSNTTTIAVQPPIMAPGRNDEIYVHLTGFNIPYAWYIIDDDNNKVDTVMTINNSATTTSETHTETFVLPPANYTILTIASALQSLINQALKSNTNFPANFQTNNVCTISYDTDTNKLTFHLDYTLFKVSASETITVTFNFGSGTQQAYRALGFTRQSYSFQANQSTTTDLTSAFQCNLFISNYIVIHSNFLTSNATTTEQGVAEGDSDILAMVPIMTPPFSFLTLDKTSTQVSHTRVRQKVVSSITIKITDENNRELDFNGSQWNIGLAFEIVTEAGRRGHGPGHIDLHRWKAIGSTTSQKRQRKT